MKFVVYSSVGGNYLVGVDLHNNRSVRHELS